MSDPMTIKALSGVDEMVALFLGDRAELLRLLVDAPLTRDELRMFMRVANPRGIAAFKRTAERVKSVIRDHGPPDRQGLVMRRRYDATATRMVQMLAKQQDIIALVRRVPVTVD